MTLSNYAGLKAALARLLNRDDLDEAIPDFVALFEAEFDADPRTARRRRRLCRAQATIENEYESLATTTGLWSLDPAAADGDLRILNHVPSGVFSPHGAMH